MNVIFPEKIQIAQLPTPIQKLTRLSKLFGGPEIYVKRDDLTGMAISGNKVRKLEFVAAHAVRTGCTVLITCGGVQSNHCRATAAAAAQLGLQAHLVLRGAASALPTGNLLLDLLLGAQITYIPGANHADLDQGMARVAAEYAQKGVKALSIPMGASNALGSWGYVAAVQEMAAQFQAMAFTPDAIVVATGSAGTLTGLIIGKKLFNLSSQIIGINVCDDAAYFHSEVAKILTEFGEQYQIEIHPEQTDFQIIDGYVGVGYAKSRPEELRLIKQVAQTEGIILDPVYTGKTMYGLWQEIQKGTFTRDQKVLFIHTGGIFELFAEPAVFKEVCQSKQP